MKKIILLLYILLFITSCSEGFSRPKEVFVEGNDVSINDFYIMVYETTVNEYKYYMKKAHVDFDFNEWKYYDGPLSKFITDDDCAMANLSFSEIIHYANWLSKEEGLLPVYEIEGKNIYYVNENANGYRIPYEKEWLWASKGGKKSKNYKYCGSNDPYEIAWFGLNEIIHHPGLKKPNELGIYDMYGNVKEWCWDEYVRFAPSVFTDENRLIECTFWKSELDEFIKQKYIDSNYGEMVFIRYDELNKMNIKKDFDYIENQKSRAYASISYNSFWNPDIELNPINYADSNFEVEQYGIRLVRNASTPIKKSGKINYTRVRLRSEPNLTCETKMMLNTKEKVSVIAISTDKTKIEKDNFNWYKVVTENGTTGWVYGKYLDIEK